MTPIKKIKMKKIKLTATSKGTGLFLWKAAFTKKLLKQTKCYSVKTSETAVCLLCYERFWFCFTCTTETFRRNVRKDRVTDN